MPDVNQIYEKRIRTLEYIANTLLKPLRYASRRPDPPVGVVVVPLTTTPPPIQEAIVRWEAPREVRNITHYNIYSPDERTLVMRAPKGQGHWQSRMIVDDFALVSSYNELTEAESILVPSIPAE